MKMLLAIIFAIVVVAWGSSAYYAVDRTEFVYLTQFGRLVETLDGETEAGLHFKWPWPIQTIQHVDHRLQVFDLPPAELLTHDPRGKTIDKTLTISAYVCWRIADSTGVDRFIRTVGTPERAETILSQRIGSRLGAEIGRMKLEDLIATDKSVEERMDALSQRLLDQPDSAEISPDERAGLRTAVERTYGIALIDIRLRRFNYPAQVREAIFDRIRSERNKKVADYQSEGKQLARKITSEAEYEERILLADARGREQRLKTQAEADADRIRNLAQGKDPAFYAFLKKLEEYQNILGDNKTVLLLASHRELFDLLFKPPSPEATPPSRNSPGPVTAKSTAKTGAQ